MPRYPASRLTAASPRRTLSGITTFISGAPITPSFTSSVGEDIAGSASASVRLDVIGDARQPTVPGTFFNTAAFAQPARGSLGNLGRNSLLGPATNNWDVTITKAIPTGLGEGRGLKLQVQAATARSPRVIACPDLG